MLLVGTTLPSRPAGAVQQVEHFHLHISYAMDDREWSAFGLCDGRVVAPLECRASAGQDSGVS